MPRPDADPVDGAAEIDVESMAKAVLGSDRAALSRAITLVESTRADHRSAAGHLLEILTPHAGKSWRVGISGLPGVGKSTFIEVLGSRLTAAGHRVGVLAVDPSSSRTGGSVLGDKTRMPRLGADPLAYVRPSPTAGTLGGVTRATSQAITVLEAAGFDIVLVETVGVGQSETAVAGMVDTFVLLGLARTGDQLQGIKKGVLEIADIVAVNKADGEHAGDARVAARELAGALRLVYAGAGGWVPPVVTCSGLTGDGIDEVWNLVARHREFLGADGVARKRSVQQWDLVLGLVTDELNSRLRHSPRVAAIREEIRARVLSGALPTVSAAAEILAAFDAG